MGRDLRLRSAVLLATWTASWLAAVACTTSGGAEPGGGADASHDGAMEAANQVDPAPTDASANDATPDEDLWPICSEPAPTTSDAGTSLLQVALGSNTTCALTRAGEVSCWGHEAVLGGALPTVPDGGPYGAGNRGGTRYTFVPKPVALGSANPPIAITTAGGPCALRANGAITCWPPAADGKPAPPVEVNGFADATQLAGGGSVRLCATRAGGEVRSFSRNDVRSGFTIDSLAAIPGMTGAVEAAVGGNFQCARTSGGTVLCYGSNMLGQLGHGGPAGLAPPPAAVQVQGLSDAVQIAASSESACALRQNGTVVCWGSNRLGSLGTGAPGLSDAGPVYSTTPVQVAGLRGVRSIAGGDGVGTFCAITSCGTVACWGSNLHGQLGDGTTVNRHKPVKVVGIDDAVSVAVGAYHACAIRPTSLECWGSNELGAVGVPGSDGGADYPTPQVARSF